jgi:hypothetical protein
MPTVDRVGRKAGNPKVKFNTVVEGIVDSLIKESRHPSDRLFPFVEPAAKVVIPFTSSRWHHSLC